MNALTTPLRALTSAARTLARIVRRRPWLAVLAIAMVLAAIGAFSPMPASAAPENGDGYTPAGFGDLLKGPAAPSSGRTLYETYSITAFYFDTSRLGAQDSLMLILNNVASVVMFLTAAIIRGAIVLSWQMFDFSNYSALIDALTPTIGATANELNGWLLPTALAVGGITAYAQQRSGSGLGQLLWVLAGGLLAVSFATSPGLWVNTLSDVRNVTVSSVVGATSNELTVADTPFVFEGAVYDNSDPAATMMRKSGDAMWRTFVVTPWCIAEFGSQEACSVYGKGLLDAGLNPETRTEWIQKNEEGHPGYFDDSAAGYKWVAGKNAADRLGIAIIALVVAACFGVLVMALSFAGHLAWIAAIMLLAIGVFFAIMACIPGKPRQWTMRWLDGVVGATIQSVMGALILSATLVLTTAAFSVSGDQGWAVGAGMALTIAFAAFTMRRTIAGILTAMTPGMGMSTLIGAMAIRTGARALGGAGRALGGGAWGAAKGAGRGASRGAGRGAEKLGGAMRDRRLAKSHAGAIAPKYRSAPGHQPREPQALGPGPSSQNRPELPTGVPPRPQLQAPNRSGTATIDGERVATPRSPERPAGRTRRTGPPNAPTQSSFGPGRGPRVIEVDPQGRVTTVHPRGVGDAHLRNNPPTRRRGRPAAPAAPIPQHAAPRETPSTATATTTRPSHGRTPPRLTKAPQTAPIPHTPRPTTPTPPDRKPPRGEDDRR